MSFSSRLATNALSTFQDPTQSPTGGSGQSQPIQPGNSLGGAALYLYTFLATVALLIGISAFIVIRTVVQRRRLRRLPPGGIGAAGPDRSAAQGQTKADLSVVPTFWEVGIAPNAKYIDYEKTSVGKVISSSWRWHKRSLDSLTWSSILPLSSVFLSTDQSIGNPTSGSRNVPHRLLDRFLHSSVVESVHRRRSPDSNASPIDRTRDDSAMRSETEETETESWDDHQPGAVDSEHLSMTTIRPAHSIPQGHDQHEQKKPLEVIERTRLQVTVLVRMPAPPPLTAYSAVTPNTIPNAASKARAGVKPRVRDSNRLSASLSTSGGEGLPEESVPLMGLEVGLVDVDMVRFG